LKFSPITNQKAMNDYIEPVETINLEIVESQITMVELDKSNSLCFRKYSEIENDAAELLSKYQGYINLGDLTKLSDAAANSLSKHQGGISLYSLKELSDAAVEALSKKVGTINGARPQNWEANWRSINYLIDAVDIDNKPADHKWFKGEPSGTITLKLAQKFLKNKKSVRLDKYTGIHNDAAEFLSRYRGWLPLCNLIELSDEAAEFLSNHQGSLDLDSLIELSDAGVEFLSKHKGSLKFYELQLSNRAAESLSSHMGELSLWMHDLSDATLDLISKHRGPLSFFGLFELSDAAAKSLSEHQGVLNLGRLQVLSWKAATYLAAKKGTIDGSDPEWSYSYVEEMIDTDAESISKHQGDLSLSCSSIIELSDNAAESLSRKEGTICGETPAEWVEKFQNEQRSKTIDLKSVQSRFEMAKVSGMAFIFSDKYFIDDDAAEALSKHNGKLSLSLHRLSDAVAESLSKHQGKLSITWLRRMSDAAAKSLSKHQGDLLLNFVWSGRKKMSDTAFESLSKHKGDIHFVGLNQQLSEAAAKALSRKKGTICGKAPAEWIKEFFE